MGREAKITEWVPTRPAPAPRSRRGLNEKREGLSGPAEKCVPADGGAKWSHNFGQLQERAKATIRLGPGEMPQVHQCPYHPLGVRRTLPQSGVCSDRVTGNEVSEYHCGRKPAHRRVQDVSETAMIRVARSPHIL